MKQISLLLAIFLVSTNANAESSAGATLSNFQLNVISGDALSPYLDTLSVNINNNVSNKFITNVYDYTNAVGLPLSLTLTTVDGLSSATGSAAGTSRNQSLSASALTTGGVASSVTSGSMQIAYKAFTLFSFAADATVYGSADAGNGVDYSGSWSDISLSKTSFDGAFLTTSINSNLTSGSGLFESGEYTSSKQIKFFFFDDKDGFIQLNASVNAYAVAAPAVAPVPEPETYAMLLVGLGLVTIASRRRRFN